MSKTLERHEHRKVVVVPIILRRVSWQETLFSELQVLPRDAKPVKTWPDLDEAFLNVVEGIREIVERLTPQPSSLAPLPTIPIKALVSASPATNVPLPAKPALAIKPEEFTLIRTGQGHWASVQSITISPDGQTFASGSEDYSIKPWNLNTGQLLRTIDSIFKRQRQIYCIAISPDGQTLASGSDNTIKLWNMHTGKLLHRLKGHSDEITSVVFSPDGQMLVSGSRDKTIKIWGKEVTSP